MFRVFFSFQGGEEVRHQDQVLPVEPIAVGKAFQQHIRHRRGLLCPIQLDQQFQQLRLHLGVFPCTGHGAEGARQRIVSPHHHGLVVLRETAIGAVQLIRFPAGEPLLFFRVIEDLVQQLLHLVLLVGQLRKAVGQHIPNQMVDLCVVQLGSLFLLPVPLFIPSLKGDLIPQKHQQPKVLGVFAPLQHFFQRRAALFPRFRLLSLRFAVSVGQFQKGARPLLGLKYKYFQRTGLGLQGRVLIPEKVLDQQHHRHRLRICLPGELLVGGQQTLDLFQIELHLPDRDHGRKVKGCLRIQPHRRVQRFARREGHADEAQRVFFQRQGIHLEPIPEILHQ